MKPLDSRLLRYARSARGVLVIGGLLGVIRTIAIIAWCWCLAQVVAALALPVLGGMGGAAGRVAEGAYPVGELPMLMLMGNVALVVRSAAGWGMDLLASRGAVKVKSELRKAALDAIDSRSPDTFAGTADVRAATVLGRGLDALDGYFSSYLPQLILTICATPLLVLVVLLADPLSGITVLIVFPVIPVFMVLIGLATRAVQQKQWDQLQHLSRSFLDVVEGLTTLKIFGREDKQVRRITREAGEYRNRTMHVLRVTFLSGFVLDLAGTFSIALVAVTVGTRLVAGEFPLALGLFVLLLLPETFLPIRQVGSAFHSSTEGLAASEQIFEIIESPTTPSSSDPAAIAAAPASSASRAHSAGIHFAQVEVRRSEHIIVGPVTFSVQPGEVVALVGPSGAGKSTLIAALLGFVQPTRGDLTWPAQLAWAGQRPSLMQGSVAENVALGEPQPDEAMVRRALDAVGLHNIGTDLQLGVQGAGLSGGQSQRVAIARALYRAWVTDAGALVLDEPSSALDAVSEAGVARVLRDEAAAGRAVLIVSHRHALIAAADRTVQIQAAQNEAAQNEAAQTEAAQTGAAQVGAAQTGAAT
ncbi:MAG: thiol reductant ABC exporter subunit CydD [Leucobacter sp.]|nr:thiol reductant ABC exporter subunit CydD [Leucobacter sp.]